MLGRPDSTDPAQTLDRIAAGGNAGYCFHHNGAFEIVLLALGPRRAGRGRQPLNAKPGWRATVAAATLAAAVRATEEVVPVNMLTWVLPCGVTVGR